MPSTVADLSARDARCSATLVARTFRLWPESVALFVIGVPIAWLTWRSAGVDPSDQAVGFAWILAATAGLGMVARGRYAVALPWPALPIALLPALQLLPQPLAPAPGIELIHQQLLAAGIAPPAQISIYPYATIQGSFALAGCCTLFALARSLTARSMRAAVVIIASILMVGLAQSIIGLQQHLVGQSLDNPASQFAHGTFVNRDHYAAFMEGCFGLAVGVVLAGVAGRDWRRWLVGRESAFTIAALLVATACAAATVFSYSRMGILVLAAMALSVLVVTLIRNHGAALLLLVTGAMAAYAVSAAGLRGLAARFSELIAQQGDPGRLAMWRDTLRIAPDFLWTGVGLGAFPFVFRRREPYLPLKGIDHAHSDYLELLVELGLPGAVLLFGAIAYVVIQGLWKLKAVDEPVHRWTGLGCLLGAGGIFAHALVDFPLRIPAVAATVAVLLGCAHGLTVPPGRPARVRKVASVALMAGVALAGLLFMQGRWAGLDAATLSRQAHTAGMQGLLDEAAHGYTASLSANPFAAATWIARAELAEAEAQPEEALRMMRIAATIEPFTLRTEWALANLLMRQGEYREAARHFGTVAASIPGMRATILEAASAGGIPARVIAADIVPPDGEAAGELLIHLVRDGAWADLVPCYESLPAAAKHSIPDHLLRYVFDQAFAAGETAIYLELWRRMELGELSKDVLELTLSPAETGDGSKGFGLRWVSRPQEDVTTRFEMNGSDVAVIEVLFTKSQNLHYAHLSRDFAVRPGGRYTLLAEIRSEDLGSSEGVRLLLTSPDGSLTESAPIRRTTPWKQVRLSFRAGNDDHVLRLFVARYPVGGFDNRITGGFYLRNVRVIAAA